MKNKKEQNEMITIYDLFAEQRKRERKRVRKEYFEEHRFDILNFIIAVLALIVSILGLFLP